MRVLTFSFPKTLGIGITIKGGAVRPSGPAVCIDRVIRGLDAFKVGRGLLLSSYLFERMHCVQLWSPLYDFHMLRTCVGFDVCCINLSFVLNSKLIHFLAAMFIVRMVTYRVATSSCL